MVLLLPRCAREMDVFPEISFLLLIILYELVGRVFFPCGLFCGFGACKTMIALPVLEALVYTHKSLELCF